jgi:hypothetical protein
MPVHSVKRVVLCILLLGAVIGTLSGCFLFPNRPPVASFTVIYNVTEDPMVVDLDATASSDPDGDAITAYLWKFGNQDDDVEILTPLEYTKQVSVPVLRVRYPDEGTREAQLLVIDERGAASEPVVRTITLPHIEVEPTL